MLHVEATEHSGLALHLVRWGPLVAFALVGVWALLERGLRGRLGRRSGAAAGGGLVLVAAGLIHVLLVPAHAEESAVAGVFFAVSGLLEVALGAGALWRPTRRLAMWSGLFVAGMVLLYVESRIWGAPFSPRGPIDAIGLVTKVLEVSGAVLLALAAGSGVRWRPDREVVAAAVTGGLALMARPLFEIGPRPVELAASVLPAVLAAFLFAGGRPGRTRMARAVSDGAVLALLLRSPVIALFVATGVLAGIARGLGRDGRRLALAPVPAAAVAVLAVGSWNGRMEILHVSHGEGLPSLTVFLAGVALAVVVWSRGTYPTAAAFLAAHLLGQAIRILGGATNVPAMEVPAASIGIFLVATQVLGDGDVVPAGARGTLTGFVAGGLDVVFRHLEIPYPPLMASALAVAIVVGSFGAFEHAAARQRGATPVGQ